MAEHEAILIVGPTGSGKTPLGDLFEKRGLWGRPCAHFDFGRELRRTAAASGRPEPVERAAASGGPELVQGPGFTPHELAFIRRVLDEGLLLEDEHFHIAERILTAFIRGRDVRGHDGGAHGVHGHDARGDRICGHDDCAHDVRGDDAVTPRHSPLTPFPSPLFVLNGLPRHASQAVDVDRILRVRLIVHLTCTPEVVMERIRTNAGGDRAGRADDNIDAVRRKLALFEKRTKPLIEHYEKLGVPTLEIAIETNREPESLWEVADAVDLLRCQ